MDKNGNGMEWIWGMSEGCFVVVVSLYFFFLLLPEALFPEWILLFCMLVFLGEVLIVCFLFVVCCCLFRFVPFSFSFLSWLANPPFSLALHFLCHCLLDGRMYGWMEGSDDGWMRGF